MLSRCQEFYKEGYYKKPLLRLQRNPFKFICRSYINFNMLQGHWNYYCNKDLSLGISCFQKTSLSCTFYCNTYLFLWRKMEMYWVYVLPPKTIFLRGKRISLVATWDFTPAKTSADTENVISSPILNIRLQLTVELCVLIIFFSVFHNKKAMWLSSPWHVVYALLDPLWSLISGSLKTITKMTCTW